MNDWEETTQVLREAYKNNVCTSSNIPKIYQKNNYFMQTADDVPVSPALLSFSSQPSPSVENLLVEGTHPWQHDEEDIGEDLDIRGSLKNIDMLDGRDDKKVQL